MAALSTQFDALVEQAKALRLKLLQQRSKHIHNINDSPIDEEEEHESYMLKKLTCLTDDKLCSVCYAMLDSAEDAFIQLKCQHVYCFGCYFKENHELTLVKCDKLYFNFSCRCCRKVQSQKITMHSTFKEPTWTCSPKKQLKKSH